MFEGMDQAIEKYYLILEEGKKNYPRYKEIIERVQRMLKNGKSDVLDDDKILINFKNIVSHLDFGNLTLKEKMQIILFLLRIDVYNFGFDKDNVLIDREKILNYPFEEEVKAKIEELIQDGKSADFLMKDSSLLSPEEQKVQLELDKAITIISQSSGNPIDIFSEIKKHFFDKYPYLEKEDIDVFLESLKSLGLSSEMVECFAIYLGEEQEDRKKQEPTYEESLLAKLYDNLKKVSQIFERKIVDYINISRLIDNEQLLKKVNQGRRLTNKERLVAYTDTFSETMSKNDFDNLSKIIAGASIYNYLRYPERAYFSQTLIINFEGLNLVLGASSFTKVEITDFIFWCLKRDIEIWNFDPEAEAITDSVDNKPKIQFDSVFEDGLFFESMLNRYAYDMLTPPHQYVAINSNVKDINFSNFKDNLMTIDKHYFKKERLTREDIDAIIVALKNLGLAKPYLQSIKSTLTKRNLRKPKAPKAEPIIRERQNMELKSLISKKEYNRIWMELNECYNFDQMFPIRYLTEEEIIDCVVKLRRIDFSSDKIQRFLKTAFKENLKGDVHTLIKYKDMYDKIQYFLEMYPTDERVISVWQEIQSAFSKMMLSSPDDYEFLKEYLAMELGEFVRVTDNDYSYEIEEVSKRELLQKKTS